MRIVREILELKGIVDDHLGVQPAVRRLVDILEEQAVEMPADFCAAIVLVERITDHRKIAPYLFSFILTHKIAFVNGEIK